MQARELFIRASVAVGVGSGAALVYFGAGPTDRIAGLLSIIGSALFFSVASSDGGADT